MMNRRRAHLAQFALATVIGVLVGGSLGFLAAITMAAMVGL